MKKFIVLLLFIFSLVGVLSGNTASAANGKVSLKSYYYKGQPYVQVVNHPNKSVAAKMNKDLKNHAVRAAATANSKEFKQNKGYYYKTSVQTSYNKNNALSIVYYTYAYSGGAHDMQWLETFNYDSSTGTRIYLKDFLDTRSKIVNANVYLQSILKKRNQADPGSILYEDTVINLKTGTFFYNDKGFTLRFSPYEVAAFSEGFVDVYIPYDAVTPLPVTNQTAPTTPQQQTPVSIGVKSSEVSIYSNDLKTFLGTLSTNTFDRESIFNEFGTYGSPFNTKSIWNEFGTYGSEFSTQSAFNEFTRTPPVLVYDGQIFGYVTMNTFLKNSITPNQLYEFAKSLD